MISRTAHPLAKQATGMSSFIYAGTDDGRRPMQPDVSYLDSMRPAVFLKLVGNSGGAHPLGTLQHGMGVHGTGSKLGLSCCCCNCRQAPLVAHSNRLLACRPPNASAPPPTRALSAATSGCFCSRKLVAHQASATSCAAINGNHVSYAI